MPERPHLIRRGGAYSTRLRVPQGGVERIGWPERTKGLGALPLQEAVTHIDET